jgi:hypothetical protein
MYGGFMETFKAPKAHPVGDGHFVTIPNESFKALCETINTLVEVVNAHSSHIESLDKLVKETDEDITKIAKILEDIYEAQV